MKVVYILSVHRVNFQYSIVYFWRYTGSKHKELLASYRSQSQNGELFKIAQNKVLAT